MFTRRLTSKDKTILYVIGTVVIIVVILLLSQGTGRGGMMHGNRSIGLESLNWAQILISLVIGFVLGLLFSRRRL